MEEEEKDATADQPIDFNSEFYSVAAVTRRLYETLQVVREDEARFLQFLEMRRLRRRAEAQSRPT